MPESIKLPTHHTSRALQTVDSSLQTNLQHFSSRKFFELEQTTQLLSEFVKNNPDSIDEYISLGRLFRIRGYYRKAFKLHRNLLYRPSLSKKTKAKILTELGFDYLESQTSDYGQDYFERALGLHRNLESAEEGLFLSYQRRNQYINAITWIKKICKRHPEKKSTLARVYAELSLAQLKNKQIKQAKKSIKKSFKVSKEEAFSFLVRAQIELHEKQNDLAKNTLQSFIEKWPGYSLFALKKLEDLHYETNSYGDFGNCLQKILAHHPNNSYVHHYLANHHIKMKKNDAAKTSFQEALHANPHNIHAVEDYLHFCLDLKEIDLAQSIVRGFSLALKSKREFECLSCKKSFAHIPKDCTRCMGWNTFRVRYRFEGP
ncbi:MAG: hypothetical protein KDD52_02535 [Bdellovibrionales bacterium]|nr:hypothetical protein [Bdellovibrionales bacterium]